MSTSSTPADGWVCYLSIEEGMLQDVGADLVITGRGARLIQRAGKWCNHHLHRYGSRGHSIPVWRERSTLESSLFRDFSTDYARGG